MKRSYYDLCCDAIRRYAGKIEPRSQREEYKLLTLYEVIFDEQMIALPRTKEVIEPAREVADERVPRDRRALMPSVEEMADLFQQIAAGVEARCPEALKDVALILNLCRTGRIDYQHIAQAAAEGDQVAIEDMASEADVDTDSLLIIVRESLRPFVFLSAQERLPPDWQESNTSHSETECPNCGSEPSLMEETTGRFPARSLLCSFCGTLWPTQRTLCLFCENTNPSRFTQMESGSSIPARADVCETCKMYIKVLSRMDSDKGNPISLYIDDLLTRHLDSMVEQEEYEGTAKQIFSIF